MAILIPVEDRVSTYPGRIQLLPVSGQANVYDMSRADEPVQEGTPLNKALLDQKAYTLTEDTVVYVSTTGSDADGDGSAIAPFATIQTALNALPKVLGGHAAVISIGEGTYEERITVDGFSGGNLVIGEIGRNVVIRGIGVENSSHVTVNIPNVTWAAGFSAAIVSIDYNSAVALGSSMTIDCNGSAENGVVISYGSELVSVDAALTVMNCTGSAIRVTYGSRAAFHTIAGSNNTGMGLVAERGGSISYSTSTLTSTKGDVATTGGCILTGNGVPVPGTNTIGNVVRVNAAGDGYTLEPAVVILHATIPVGSWTEQGERFVQTVAVPGIRESDRPDVDVSLEGLTIEQENAVIDAWGGAAKIVTADGSLVCNFTSQPEVAIPIKIKVVR